MKTVLYALDIHEQVWTSMRNYLSWDVGCDCQGNNKQIIRIRAYLLSITWSKSRLCSAVTEVPCPVIGRAQPEFTRSKRQKMGPDKGAGHVRYGSQ